MNLIDKLSVGTKATLFKPQTMTVGTQTKETQSSLSSQIRNLKERLKKANAKIKYFRSHAYIKQRLTRSLRASNITPATTKRIATGKRPKKYSREDIAAGAVLRAISPKAFNIIRMKSWMQLPSRRTVENWLQDFKIKEGFQDNLIDVVKTKHPEPAAREVFLSFDEMSLKERWVYNKVHNNVRINNLR